MTENNPVNTSENSSENAEENSSANSTTLKFANEHVEPILDGEKWITLRHDLDEDLRPGDHLTLVDADSGDTFATATVDVVSNCEAGWFVDADRDGHRSYRSTGQLLDELRRYYPDANLTPSTVLTAIEWRDVYQADDYDRGPYLADPRGANAPDNTPDTLRGDRR